MVNHKYDNTLGALFIGAIAAIFLSGIMATQVFMYWRLYPKDHNRFKIMVAIVWALDLAHSAMVCAANWFYLVENFANLDAPNQIAWPVDATIALTAWTTLVVHIFFTQRVYTLSKQNLVLTVPIGVLAVLRVVSALACTASMSRAKTWEKFRDDSAWLFTTGLSVSAALDVLIAGSLIILLHKSRTGWKSMDHLINTIVVYTIENGLLTSIFAVMSLICWVTMSGNLIFLALHFTIAKLYANSFLATLNARKTLQQRSHSSSGQQMSVLFPSRRIDLNRGSAGDNGLESVMQISVEKTIHRVTEDPSNPVSPVIRFASAADADARTDSAESMSKRDHAV
ncbi:hypothetical protein BDW22DRAFT_1350524 [Trametopsis cervina]|nr:hypothetical protein BDW22DRAFT_1350524 [Trametopsis cervina]